MTDNPQEQNGSTATVSEEQPTASPTPAGPDQPLDNELAETAATGAPLKTDIDMLRDVELRVTAELGRTKLTIGEITNLAVGSIVSLSKSAGDPADLRINDQLFASGEVIVMDGYFAVKITKLLSKEERMKHFS